MPRIIYMDYHATTPVDARVAKAMWPYLSTKFGNAASLTHALGRENDRAVSRARDQVARLVGAAAREIIFTSGATESNNLALKGVAHATRSYKKHMVSVCTEHKSVLDPLKRLASEGFKVTLVPVGRDGRVDLAVLRRALTRDTLLVSVMLANNEVGTIQPVAEIARIARHRGILFHCDASQAVGRIPVDVKALGVDLMSFSAHKLYGPKGVGALYIRKTEPRVRLKPLTDGGGHEGGFRSGTLNVPGLVGFGVAAEIAGREMKKEAARLRALRDRLWKTLEGLGGVSLNGSFNHRLHNNLNVSFEGVNAKALMEAVPQIAVSSGSACTSTSIEPSYVLRGMGVSESQRASAIRFGLGRMNTVKDVQNVVKYLSVALRRLRASRKKLSL